MATVLGPFAISGVTGSGTLGPAAIPAGLTQVIVDFDRTVGSPTINSQPNLRYSVEMEYSFDGGVTYPRTPQGGANGGGYSDAGGIPKSAITTHVIFGTSIPFLGGLPADHVRANFTVSGGTFNSSVVITLS